MATQTVNDAAKHVTLDCIMTALLDKASKTMEAGDLDILSESVESVVEEQTHYLSETIRNIANSVILDKSYGSLHQGEEAGRLLYVLAHNVEVIGVLSNLAANARYHSNEKAKANSPFGK